MFSLIFGQISITWNNDNIHSIAHNTFNNILFSDDLCLFQVNEDNSRRAVFTFTDIGKHYRLKVSESKTKVMALQGKDPSRSKITLENKTSEQISHFNYLGRDASFEYHRDIKNKWDKFQYICETIRRTLRNSRENTRKKIFKTLAIPTLLYGSEFRILKKSDWTTIHPQKWNF